MDVKILENEKDKIKIEVNDVTFANLINEYMWEQKTLDYSSYALDHPYLSNPVIIVKSKNPKKTVTDAVTNILSDIKSFRQHFKAK